MNKIRFQESAPGADREASADGQDVFSPHDGQGRYSSCTGDLGILGEGGSLSMRRVVVTGLGVVAPNGIGQDASRDAGVNGGSGVRARSAYDACSFPIKTAGEVQYFNPSRFIPDSRGKSMKVMGRAARFGVGAAGLALQDSGISMENEIPERIG